MGTGSREWAGPLRTSPSGAGLSLGREGPEQDSAVPWGFL